jgi:pilus assembly protein CpaF
VPLNGAEKGRAETDLLDEVFGLGPLEPLLKDPAVSDILVNNKDVVYVERHGILERTKARFRDDRHLLQVIDRIVSRVGRRVDESSPMVDARLPDGSRVNAIIPPLALDGPCMSIRRFGTGPVAADALVKLKSISAEMMQILAAAVKAKISILISGGTGAGKTTFMNILSSFIPETERIVTIEDAAQARRCGAARNQASQRGGSGGRAPETTPDQQSPHAAGPDHHRRGSRRRSVRHVAGHEYRA